MSRRFFMSVGDPSGDVHAGNLISAISRQARAQFVGVGGANMAARGCEILYPLVDHPIMGIRRAIAAVPTMRRVLRLIEGEFDSRPPDACILIDFPGFNWQVAKLAHRRGIPVVYYIPPQLWAWATHRVKKLHRWVDHVLCTLPFEKLWYEQRGIRRVIDVGHPFFDDLQPSPVLDESARTHQQRVVLLPGSRPIEIQNNADLLLKTGEEIRRRVPSASLAVAAFDGELARCVRERADRLGIPIEIRVGQTRSLLQQASAAVAVSGSVSLELLHYEVPAAIVYSVNWFWERVFIPLMLNTPHVSLVNLLAGRRLFPEFVGAGDYVQPIAATVENWLTHDPSRSRVVESLRLLKREYARPGASQRAAEYILEQVTPSTHERRRVA